MKKGKLLRDIPDCLKGDQATSNLVWADFHDIDLAGDSKLISENPGAYQGLNAYWRTPIPAPLQSLATAYYA